MRRVVFAAALALAALAVSAPAHAQIAGAIGKPLPAPDFAVGTVSVRIIAGSPANPVTGVDVTLVVNGAPRVARTDSAGRAFFKDLPAGAKVQAKALDDNKQEMASDEFELPSEGGVHLMLTTRPFDPGAGGGMAAGAGGQGMPDPLQISGEPRPEQSDTPGTLTIRLTYDDLKAASPVGTPVTLVGYQADDKVTVQTQASDKDGRVQFTGLDRSGATSYFALTQLARGGAIDRLMSQPAVLDPQAGVRLLLSADKRDSKAPPIDDLARIERESSATPAGKVRITIEGEAETSAEVQLIDAATRAVVGKATPALGAPDPTNVAGRAHFEANPDVPVGTLDVQAHGGAGPTNEPLEGVGVRVIPADAKAPPAGLVASKTPADGTLRMALATPGRVKAVVTINGRDFVTEPFELAKSGGVLDVEAHWEQQGRPEAVIDLAPAGQTVYAETVVGGQVFRSLPFQPVEGRGAHVTIFALRARVLFSFSWTSQINDEYLLVGGRFDVYNNSWAPYVASSDGLVVPLPDGFGNAQVNERDQGEVAVAPGQGLRLIRPVPPGQRVFHAQFTLPVENGGIQWRLPLPLGAIQSALQIQETPGMEVKPVGNVKGETENLPEGTYYVMPQINIRPQQAMEMTISGMPAAPAWKIWVPRVIGVVVIGTIATGLGLALRRRTSDPTRADRRAKLLDELVELEKAGARPDDKRREAVLAELEQLWD